MDAALSFVYRSIFFNLPDFEILIGVSIQGSMNRCQLLVKFISITDQSHSVSISGKLEDLPEF